MEFVLTFVGACLAAFFTFFVTRAYLKQQPSQDFVFSWTRSINLTPLADIVVLILFFLYCLVFVMLVLMRHESVHSDVDLAIFNQVAWNSLNGRLLETSTNLAFTKGNVLGLHFSPLLIALVPLYAILSDARTLLIAQTIFLAATVFPIYWFARTQLGKLLALGIALSIFLSPSLEYVTLADFHEIALATPLLAFACFFLLRRCYVPLLVCLLVTLLIKEEIGLIVVAMGLYIFLVHRERILGAGLTIVGLISLALILYYIIPIFSGGNYQIARYHYTSLGTSVPEIITSIFYRPGHVLATLLEPRKVEFILHLIVPLAFVPLAGLDVAVICMPILAGLLLTSTEAPTSIRYQYTAPLVPFVFFAGIIGARRILDFTLKKTKLTLGYQRETIAAKLALFALILTASLASYYFNAPAPLARNYVPANYHLDDRTSFGKSLIQKIPRDAVVAAGLEWVPQLSGRRGIYEIATIDDYRQADYVFADRQREWYNLRQSVWDADLASGFFEILDSRNDYILARRRSPTHYLQIDFDNHMRFLGSTIFITDTVKSGRVLRPIFEWQALMPIHEKYSVATQVIDTQGHVWAVDDREPVGGFSPTDQWQVGRTVGDQYALRLPPTMPEGEYQIVVSVHPVGKENYVTAYDQNGNLLGTEVTVVKTRIEKDKKPYTASELWWIEQKLFVDFGEIRLLGYVPPRKTIKQGESLSVGVYWRARSKPRGDYVVAVQLRDLNGTVAFEHAARPANNTYPTLQWDEGEVLLDWHDFTVPRNLSAGKYQIAVVLGDALNNVDIGQALISTISVLD